MRSRDASGNERISSDFTFTTTSSDTVPPVISNVVTSPAAQSATITWTTDEGSTSQVEYGLTTAYGSTTVLAPALVTSHTVTVSGLTAGTLYHYRVRSRDASGNERISSDFAFTTTSSDTVPPVISTVAATVTTQSATITWTTDEGSTSQVEYGLTTAYGSTTVLDSTLVTSHTVTVSGLTQGTLYHYRVRSRDASGNERISSDFTFTTSDTVPPVISNVVTSPAAQSATITWTTDEGSTSQVEYGLTTAYGSTTVLAPALVTSHTVTVSGLTQGTLYHYRVRSRDASGNERISSDFTFTTSDTVPPVISNVVTSPAAQSATITWTTDEGSTSQVEYGLTTAYGSSTVLAPALVTSHMVTVSGLTQGTLYHYRVRSRDASGNERISSDFTFTTTSSDTVPPVISNVVTSPAAQSATISWTTDEGSTSQVEYGLTTAYGSTTVLAPALVTSHTVTVSGLTQGTLYHYRVRSRDASGNERISSDFTFTTRGGGPR